MVLCAYPVMCNPENLLTAWGSPAWNVGALRFETTAATPYGDWKFNVFEDSGSLPVLDDFLKA